MPIALLPPILRNPPRVCTTRKLRASSRGPRFRGTTPTGLRRILFLRGVWVNSPKRCSLDHLEVYLPYPASYAGDEVPIVASPGRLEQRPDERRRARELLIHPHLSSLVKKTSGTRDGAWDTAPPRSGIFTLRTQLLCGCLARCFRGMSFQALFGDAQGLLVQPGLLCHVPSRGDYSRPESHQCARRRDGLLPEDPYARLYPGPVCLRFYLYVQGGLQPYDGLEDASPANADLHPSCGDVRFGHLVVLALKVAHQVLSNGSEVFDNVEIGRASCRE